VPAVYGGYFYNDTLSDAQICEATVKKAVASKISPDIPIYVKRGCTEYEKEFPESKHWKIPPGQKEYEAELDDLLVLEVKRIDPPDYVVRNAKRKWVERAGELGHEYRQFTGGKTLPFIPLITTF